MERITKSIGFAYPTSTHALLMKAGQSGCFTVEVWHHGPTPRTVIAAGPFGTVREAEQYADQQLWNVPWEQMYMDHPQRGSKFRLVPLPTDLVQPSAFMQAR